MYQYLFPMISAAIGGAGVTIACYQLTAHGEERNNKSPNVMVDKIEWVQGTGIEGELQVTVKNFGARPAKNIRVSIRMIDCLLKSWPAPDFDFSMSNELPGGATYTHSINWLAMPIYTHVNVQALVLADDVATGKPLRHKMSNYIWGKYDVFRLDQPFLPMPLEDHEKLMEYLIEHNHRRKIGSRRSVFMIPGVPTIPVGIGNSSQEWLPLSA